MDEPRPGQRYDIRTVADFLTVPPDRLDACLREFGIMLRMAHVTKASLNAATKALGHADAIAWQIVDRFDWVDDDANMVTISVLDAHGEILSTHEVPPMPERPIDALVDRLRAMLAAHPKHVAVPVDVEDVRAMIAKLTAHAPDVRPVTVAAWQSSHREIL